MSKIKNVVIDYREGSRVSSAKSFFEDYNVITTTLQHGDFLFQNDTDNMNVLFEYKTGNDFLTSINNKHIFNQTVRACQNYKYQFIIVQVHDMKSLIDRFFYQSGVDMSIEQVNGALASLNTISTVLFADTLYDSFDLMYRQATKVFEDKPLTYKFQKKSMNPALNFLHGVHGIDKQVEVIVDKFNLYSLYDLFNLTENDLKTVPNIGEAKAKNIYKAIHGE